DPHTSELRVWAGALRACVECHARDMEIVNPWARLHPKQAAEIIENLARQLPEWAGLYAILQEIPTLEKASGHFGFVLGEFSSIRERLLLDPPRNADVLVHLDVLTSVMSLCASESAALVQRLLNIAKTADAMFFAMDFKFLFYNTKKIFLI